MFNFFTISDAKSLPFLKILLLSIYKNLDSSKINKIFILSIGWEREEIQDLPIFSKLEIIKGQSRGGWTEVVKKKTIHLRQLFKENRDLPMILLDSDMIILKDFTLNIDLDCDFIVCDRGHVSPFKNQRYIGCFFVAVRNQALDFIDLWISEIKGSKGCVESPALNRAIEKHGEGFNYKKVLEREYAAAGFTNATNIPIDHPDNAKCKKGNTPYGIHFKSFRDKSYSIDSIKNRISRRSGSFAKQILKEYFDEV